MGYSKTVGVATALVQVSSSNLDQVETPGAGDGGNVGVLLPGGTRAGEVGIRVGLGVLLEQPGRRVSPTLLSVVPSCTQERVLRAAENPWWKYPMALKSPNLLTRSLAQTQEGSAGPGQDLRPT